MKMSFEDIMSGWCSTTDIEGVSKLPYFTGREAEGTLEVRGYTLIDASWYEVCSKLMWVRCKYYIKCSLSKRNMGRLGRVKKKGRTKYIFLHRFVSGMGDCKSLQIDHINHNQLDNTSVNLRVATRYENARNKKGIGGASIYKGVTCRSNKASPWRGRLEYRDLEGKRQAYTKSFLTEVEAALYFDDMQRLHRSDTSFCLFNFPKEGESSALV